MKRLAQTDRVVKPEPFPFKETLPLMTFVEGVSRMNSLRILTEEKNKQCEQVQNGGEMRRRVRCRRLAQTDIVV